MNTFSIDENLKKKCVLVTNLRKLKNIQITIHGNYDKDWRLEIKICHFWEFHKSRWINKRLKSRVTRIQKIRRQRKLGLPQSQITKKNGEREKKKNACVAVKRGVKARRNYNVFNLAMKNVLKGLPDKIRDQLSRHHAQMHFKSNEMYTFLNHFQIARSWRWSIGFLYT